MVFEYEHVVQYYETDQMGVVHHSNYIRWFEEARSYVFDKIGLGCREMEEIGIISPVVGVSAKYKTMAKYYDTVIVEMAITDFTGVRFKIRYTVKDKKTGDIRCTGNSEHCFINPEGRILSLKRDHQDLYEQLLPYITKE